MKKIFALVLLAALGVIAASVLLPVGDLSAQGLQTATPTSALGGFFGGTGTAGTVTPTPANDPVREALAKENYTVIRSGPWYDNAGKPLSTAVHVFMLGASEDPKSEASIKQIALGFATLKSAYPNATTYHVLFLSGPAIYDASTTSSALQLLSSQLITPDAWLKDVLAGMKTISLVQGGTTTAGATATPTRSSAQATSTRAPTRVPTQATTTCNAPADKARLWVKNGYSGTMRFTIGGGEWGTHDFDIPADGQYHYVDMPTGRYTYSASIPGVGKANGERQDYFAGQCYYLTFSP